MVAQAALGAERSCTVSVSPAPGARADLQFEVVVRVTQLRNGMPYRTQLSVVPVTALVDLAVVCSVHSSKEEIVWLEVQPTYLQPA